MSLCTLEAVPRLWNETIEGHRRAVHDAVLDATAALVAEHGLAAVTMSQIALATGIGRATLYKYFPDVEAIMIAWHERQITAHLHQLTEARDRTDSPGERLRTVLRTYATLSTAHNGHELAGLLHRGAHIHRAQQHLHTFVTELLADAAAAGDIRADVTPGELATYCLHALSAAGRLPSAAAVDRLLTVTLAGLASTRRDRGP
jgi:AcrR family transcriptional regulator